MKGYTLIYSALAFRIVRQRLLYISKQEGADLLILILYVDDMILIGPQSDKIADFKWELQQSFTTTDLG